MAKWIATAAACGALALLALMLWRSATSILGPSDKPDFRNMQWEKMTVVYWVRVRKDKEHRRRFELSRDDVDRARTALNIRSVRGHSLGAGDDLRITMANGDVWTGHVTFEDTIGLCLERDRYYSYVLELYGHAFYDALRDMCLAHERLTTPTAGINHIILRTNLARENYDILPSQPSQEETE